MAPPRTNRAAPSMLEQGARALTCALIPGPCVVAAVEEAQRVARAETQQIQERAQLAAAEAGVGASGFVDSVFTGVVDLVNAGAEPVAETASAARYTAVATAVVVVAIVVAIIVIAVRTAL